MSPAPIRRAAPASRHRRRRISSRSPARPRSASAPSSTCYGTDYPTPDGTCLRDYIHVSDLVAAHSAALAHLRRGGSSATFNCGYGRGASVFEVISSVKRVSGLDFPVEIAPRRAGDPAALIANVDRIHATLDWRPQFQDLDTIVAHALAWERNLAGKRDNAAA